ncbi:cephalosporin hydroxylase family protein [Bradyrhizobium jicamae]|uniref:cephalosporin hydroxylase family protein n=1 Tax=Bradyrhizobium jicamae TaxID=280332 RepID=UPI002012FAB5|nr:CmcI family methyltransferase [Bradyrhizobium jicamae]
MRINLANSEIVVEDEHGERRLALDTPEAFAVLSDAWVRSGWANRHSYTFTWFGRPVIQLPSDLMRLQELVWQLRPDVILETGIAHGGSLVFSAGLCRLLGHGRVIGVDIEIRAHNRQAIEAHDFASEITMIEGDSVAPHIVDRVRALIKPSESVLLMLDSNHSKAHVLAELEAYAPLIKPGGSIIVADGLMDGLVELPGAKDDWSWNNPKAAIADFLERHREFEKASPPSLFNERGVADGGSHWPGGYLRRIA